MILEENRKKWAAVFQRYTASGMSQREFCVQEKISLSTFGYWSAKFQKRVHDACGRRTENVSLLNNTPFVELATIGLRESALRDDEFELRSPAGISLRAGARMPVRTLLQLARLFVPRC